MRVVLTGASGFIGTYLRPRLEQDGIQVIPLLRKSTPYAMNGPILRWSPTNQWIEPYALDKSDAVIHLSGVNLADHRWDEDTKRRILRSRVKSTHLMATALASLPSPPWAFVVASAVGIYGSHPAGKTLAEDAPVGDGFLAEVCREWEEAATPAVDAGIRVVHLRLATVLGPGGMLAHALPAFRLGLGGRWGSGKQPFPWVSLHDVASAFRMALHREDLRGPVNVVAPATDTNADFTAQLSHLLHRPAFFHVPPMVLKALKGEMAEELLLKGCHAYPERLLQTGFQFFHTQLNQALQWAMSDDAMPPAHHEHPPERHNTLTLDLEVPRDQPPDPSSSATSGPDPDATSENGPFSELSGNNANHRP